jgi:hypothetical protein
MRIRCAYSRQKCVCILEHSFTCKQSVAVRKAFSNAYPGKEVPNKTTIFWITVFVTGARLVTNRLKLQPYRFQAVHQLQQRDTAAGI